MIEIEDLADFMPIQQVKGAVLLIYESFFHARSKTTIISDPEDDSRLIVQRADMTQADEDLLTRMREK